MATRGTGGSDGFAHRRISARAWVSRWPQPSQKISVGSSSSTAHWCSLTNRCTASRQAFQPSRSASLSVVRDLNIENMATPFPLPIVYGNADRPQAGKKTGSKAGREGWAPWITRMPCWQTVIR